MNYSVLTHGNFYHFLPEYNDMKKKKKILFFCGIPPFFMVFVTIGYFSFKNSIALFYFRFSRMLVTLFGVSLSYLLFFICQVCVFSENLYIDVFMMNLRLSGG